LLPRVEALHPEVPGFLEGLADLIQELVAFGTRVFEWSLESAGGITSAEEGTARVVVMNQFRWGLDVLLGIACQMRTGCCDTPKLQLRSLLETRLGLTYLLQEPVDRAHAFIACEQHRKLAFLERLDPETAAGKEHQMLCKRQGLALAFPASIASLRGEAARLRDIIARPQSDAGRRAFAEYARLQVKTRYPKWYAFYDGPRSVRRLAIDLNQGATYRVLRGLGLMLTTQGPLSHTESCAVWG